MSSWQQTVFLSSDESFSDDDLILGQAPGADGLTAETVDNRELTIVLPAETATGDWHVGVVADAEGRVGDEDRSNNASFAGGLLLVRNPSDTGPDLVICGIGIPAFDGLDRDVEPTAQIDDQLEVEICLSNNGNRPVAVARYTLYLSQDEVLDDGDIVVGQRGGVALGPGDRETFTDLVDLGGDVVAGVWNIIAVADAEELVDEQREDNNDRRWPDHLRWQKPVRSRALTLSPAQLLSTTTGCIGARC